MVFYKYKKNLHQYTRKRLPVFVIVTFIYKWWRGGGENRPSSQKPNQILNLQVMVRFRLETCVFVVCGCMCERNYITI